jgi:hypothetical protein
MATSSRDSSQRRFQVGRTVAACGDDHDQTLAVLAVG